MVWQAINKACFSHAETLDFFRYEMPNLSWKEITNVRATSSVLSYEKDQRIVTIKLQTLTDKQYVQLICPQKSNRKFNMEKEDNKNYGSVT